jgi:hypothetical protein
MDELMTATREDPPVYPMPRDNPFDPPPQLRRIQEGPRVRQVRLWDGSTPWVVTGFEEVRAALSDPRISVDTDLEGYPHVSAGTRMRKAASKTFINMDNPRHDAIRRVLTPFFTIKRVEAMRPRIQQIVDELIDDLVAMTKPVDLVQAFGLAVPSVVICELLGVPYSERQWFNELSATMISGASSPAQSMSAIERMLAFMGSLVDEKAAAPGEDMISRLVVEQMLTGSMSRHELVNLSQLLLVAGHETTSNMIVLGTLALLEHPDVLAEVRSSDDPQLIANTVEELLRWLTILHIGRRRVAIEDLELAGQQIRAGEGVIVSHDAADRDPTAFEEPDELDIHRRARHHLAFGYGIHQCLGQPLARVELQVVYSTLYRRIPTLALAVDASELRFKDANIVYGVHELPVTW